MTDPERAGAPSAAHVRIATEPGSPDRPNEDRAAAAGNTIVVVDGVTARTGTGCVHGVAWFADRLAQGVLSADRGSPTALLRSAIARTAALHCDTCDLSDPATPCAAIAIVHVDDEFVRCLVLGDVTVVLGGTEVERVVSDRRVDVTALVDRAEVDRFPVGSDARSAALVRMKRREIARRNEPGGYWIAGANPVAADHALMVQVAASDVRRVAVLTDGAARAVDLFHLCDWTEALDMLEEHGPRHLIAEVRGVERADPAAVRWPRNKVSDDATAVFVGTPRP